MAINTRQNSLLVTEDWKKIYQTFQEADFTSYDFETLRKSMIDYLRLYYPEDFNDFTESSEFIALIDLIAFMGQSLAFRTDLNARENFIDTAERRDSILKLARLISYNPKRNIASSGYLKIDSVNTTETLYDSNGLNLSNLVINWDDQSNDNWLEQFTTVVNAALVTSQVVGKPGNTQNINGIRTEEYSLNLIPSALGTFSFQSQVEDNSFDFEAVSATSVGQSYIYEAAPRSTSIFNLLYRNDLYGNGSPNTGFFVYFKQGRLTSKDVNLTEAIPNRVVSFTDGNVNNSDVWLYSLNTNNSVKDLWTAVPAVTGINVIYNKQSQRNLYQVNTKVGDQIDLVFGDGSFANIPVGNYRLYYRVSNGLAYKITPNEMRGIVIPFTYVSRTGRTETLTIRASLQYTVTNSSARETAADVKQKAPQQYYTQNRMITGEDYNILPYTSFGNVVKVKGINRTSSGISRYLDTLDPSGKYSSTNIFASDGILYQTNVVKNFKFNVVSFTNILRIVTRQVAKDIIASQELKHFYYSNIVRPNQVKYLPTGYSWQLSTQGSNTATGYFLLNNRPAQIGAAVRSKATYLRKGAIVRFAPAAGYYFDANSNMLPGNSTQVTDKKYIYAGLTEVLGDGTNSGTGNFATGVGPVTLNIKVPSGAVIDAVYPQWKNTINESFISQMVGLIKGFKNFGIGYDSDLQVWRIISSENLNTNRTFGNYEKDTSATGLDDNWLVRFSFDGDAYTTFYRGMDYVFQSAGETTFYFDPQLKVYDTKSGTVINDQITILKTNSSTGSSAPIGANYTWHVYKNIVSSDGYTNQDKIFITYADSNNDGIPDNPDIFFNVVDSPAQYVYFRSVTVYDRFRDLVSVDNATVSSKYATYTDIVANLKLFVAGQIFYATAENDFYQLSATRTLTKLSNYQAQIGRQDLMFQYRHNSPDYRRIDPSSTNVIDLYMLTEAYSTDYRNWIQDTSNSLTMPSKPTTQELSNDYSSLNNVRSVSDTIVFNSANFKPLFGYKADYKLQATFKVIKNANIATSDNDIKTLVISAINTYFDINNWDFGETFYFSELSAYLHQALTPSIASIMIVPLDTSVSFGSLYQVNAEPNEIIVSAATVENVEIITSITASQLNLSLATTNNSVLI
jgi:hypothetical protein